MRRSNQYLEMTPAEKNITDTMQLVEGMGADPLLTDAINLLSAARDKIFAFCEKQQ